MAARTRRPAIRDRVRRVATSFYPRGAYDSARSDLREFAEWGPQPGGPHSDSLGDLPYIRARARDLVRNAPIAASARQTTVLGVIGSGLTLLPRIDREYLELDKAAAAAWERQAKRIFWTWGYGTPCDLERRSGFDVLTRQVFASAWENGDAFVVRRSIARPRDLLSLKLQLIEADRCSTPDGKTSDPHFYDGVECDADGAVAAFHFSEEHPGERTRWGLAKTWNRVPAFDEFGERIVLHVRNPITEERIGALRGIPALAPIIRLFKQIDRYSNAEIMAAVVAAAFTVFLKTPQSAAVPGELAPIDAEQDEEDEIPATQYRLDSGAIYELPEGQSIETADPGRPNSNAIPFVTAMLEQCGTALNIPYEVLMRRFQASYSASKAAVEFAWKAFGMMRSWFQDDYVQPVYEWVITEAVLRGMLPAPAFFEDPLMRRAYASVEVVAPAEPQLDPLKAAQGSKALVDARFSTHQRETARLTGADWSESVTQLGEEREELQRLGLDRELTSERVVVEPDERDDTTGSDREDGDRETDDAPANAPAEAAA